jgi:transposase
MKKFKDYQPNQTILFPPSPKDWLPEDHVAYYFSEVVEQLDLSAIYSDYRDLRGQPPYQPVMMVKVLIYAVARGVHSSRKIERALYEDVGFRFLSGNQQPDHWTIAAFRRRHHKALGDLFVQTVRLANKAGLVELKHVSLDGTKIKANASKHSAMSYGRMKKEEEQLRRQISDILDQMEQIDRAEDKEYGERRGDELPAELATREKRLEAIRRAKAELEAEACEKAEKEQAKRREKAAKKGKTYRPKNDPAKAVPRDQDQKNFTDPESRIMKNADKAFIQGYNAQACVDAKTHIIVAAGLYNQAADTELLQEQVEQVKENTGHCPEELSADAGYFSADNLEYLAQEGIEAYIPPDKIRHSDWRRQAPCEEPIPEDVSLADQMRLKLRTRSGRERYKNRQTSVEPVFGYIKEEIGLRQFLLRRLEKVRSFWRFTCGVHNLMKLFRAGVVVQAEG